MSDAACLTAREALPGLVLDAARARLRLRLAALLVYGVTLAMLLAMPGYLIPRKSRLIHDKWQHGAAFLFLGVLVWRWLVAWRPAMPPVRQWMVVLAVSTVFGAVMEVVQIWVPRRTFDPLDVGWNMLGGLLSGSIAVWPRWLRRWFDL